MTESASDRAKRVTAPSHQVQRDETKARIEAALEQLKEKGIPITRENLQIETADLEAGIPGVHPATMGRRPDIADLIQEAQGTTYPSADLRHVSINHLRAGRVLPRALARLKKKSAGRLADYALVLEEEVIALWQENAELTLRNTSLEEKLNPAAQVEPQENKKKRGAE